MIVGINGRYRSGKDTVASLIAARYENVEIHHFANKLKDSAAAALGMTRDQLEWLKERPAHIYFLDPDPVASDLDQEIALKMPHFNMRTFLQRYGTEAHREIFGSDFWIRATLDNIYDAEKLVLIPDTRFPNEAEAIKARGGVVVRVSREATDNHGDLHPSEQDIDMYVDRFVNNSSSLSNLKDQVDALLSWLQDNYDVTLKESVAC